MSEEQDVQRGKDALAVLQNPAYVDAYKTLDAALVKAWRDSRDPQDREDLHRMLGLLSRLQGVMEGAVRNGQITEKEILRKRNFAERMGLARP
jgi:hypothetical protein